VPAPDAVVVRHAQTGRPEVALTFHGSGDPALAEQLLAEAERAKARITVFAVGTWLDTHPEMAQRILRGGHALGNHTYTHPTLHRLSAAGIRDEVDRCAAVLQRLTGSPGAGFRPSGGPSITPPMVTAATAAGYRLVLGYDVDPSDNTDPGADAVVSRVLAGVRPGSIVSLHLGHAGTVSALPRILAGLHERGLTPVTATALVAAS
jgi:peptidoglycan/xylan/chitin deacetylase (PgdA/CDA1 family)